MTKEPYTRLQVELKNRKITLADVAKVIGKDERTVGAKLRGESDFSITQAVLICQAFDIPLNIFFSDVVS